MKHYSETVKEEVRRRRDEGESINFIIREIGVSRDTVQSWCGLRPETRLRQLAPLPKGRPKATKTIQTVDQPTGDVGGSQTRNLTRRGGYCRILHDE